MRAKVGFISDSQLATVTAFKRSARETLHEEAMRLAANYRRCELELFEMIAVIEEKKIYMDMMIPSLFQYCTEMLRLSRQVSYDFICVVRKSKEVPELREAMLKGRTTISKLRKICPVITEKNAKIWIGLTTDCSAREVEKAVAMTNPRLGIQERMKYISGDTLQFQLAVSEEWSELLISIKDLMSQKKCRAVSSEEALFLLMRDYKEKHDPVRQAERAEKRAAALSIRKDMAAAEVTEVQEATVSTVKVKASTIKSRYIPARTRHKTNLRDQNRCAFVDSHGNRCTQTRWLQKHHIKHFAEGGDHAPENLQTLCWGHHSMMHRN